MAQYQKQAFLASILQKNQLDKKTAASLRGQKTTSGLCVERITPENEKNYG